MLLLKLGDWEQQESKKLINYNSYRFYRSYKMVKNKNQAYKEKITTIAIPMKVKEELQQYGLKGESYSDVLVRLLKSAHERLLSDVLMDNTNCVSIEEALARAEKRWSK